MKVCVRCLKSGSLFKPLRLNEDGMCMECAYEYRLEKQRAEEDKRRAEEDKRRAEEAEKRRIEREQNLRQLMQPFVPPDAQNGFVLSYSYYDVEFDSPPVLRREAQKVPPRLQIKFTRGEDDEIELHADSVKLGTMKPNKLRDMLIEFADDDEKDILGVTQYWTDKPVFSLFFYLSAELFFSRKETSPGFKIFRLVANRNSETQDNISLVSPGESLSFDYDDDKDRYAVESINRIGYLPDSFNDYIDEYPDIEIRAYKISVNTNGVYSISVACFPKD